MCCNCDQGERYRVSAPTDDNHNDSRLFIAPWKRSQGHIIMEYLAWGVQAKTYTLIPWRIRN
jgi:hypothetical protein